ncbi:MAG: (Fe-S)-binding protein [Deltaproteobacteria bacterium]|jgi:Fe-S oxidoreductase|nr:(Fe-S)-binding protein [Deltaproteobacteria bacterium]MBW2529946.1 (Fe-S)-binding protein [Deltaproteobacteria bacterium]
MNAKHPSLRLDPFVDELETCVYCPKLCRAACPVGNASANEALSPWGKMSLAYFAHRGDVPVDEQHAQPAWACTRCGACRERCEHDNDVARVLTATRQTCGAAGVAPPAARRVVERFAAHLEAVRRVLRELDAAADPAASTVLLVGCSYVRYCEDVTGHILAVIAHFVDGPVRVLRGCCGLGLLLAGDRPGFERTARDLAREIGSATRLVVADPGCARTLTEEYPEIGLDLPEVEPLVDVVAAQIERLPEGASSDQPLRYLDPCQLGRGLGRYEQPRTILERLTGRAPLALVRSGAHAECSGGGGLLPLVYPELSRAMAAERFGEHLAAGGGRLVTACGGSLYRFRRSGHEVVDLMSLVAEAIA